MSEKDLQNLENQFPAISGSVFAAARQQALASGQSVLESEQGIIYEVFPSGRTLIVYHEDDSFQVINLMLATGLEVNGRRGKAPHKHTQ